MQDKYSKQFISLLSLFLIIVALVELVIAITNIYPVDIIGRTLMTASYELSQGNAVYLMPDKHASLSMSYTPGFVVLNSILIKLFGFDRYLWNFIWGIGAFLYLIGFSMYFWRNSLSLTPIIPISLLSCTFPFLWARGDLIAYLFLGLGMIILHKENCNKFFVSSILFALALFFKQITLPIIIVYIILVCKDRGRMIKALFLTTTFFILCMLSYAYMYSENIYEIIEVLTLGKSHIIPLNNIIKMLVIYFLILIFPTIILLKINKFTKRELVILHLGSLIYVIFCSKEGSSYYNLLPITIAWLLYFANIIKTYEISLLKAFSVFSLPIILIGCFGVFPLQHAKKASISDINAAKELKDISVDLGINNKKALVLDALEGFSILDGLYENKYKLSYDRGAFEELKRIPKEILSDIKDGNFIIFERKGETLVSTAYGVPYFQIYEQIKLNYTVCSNEVYWVVYCYNKE